MADARKDKNIDYDRYRRDRQSRDFYNSTAWHRVRDAALQADQGIDVYAYMTQHKIILADTGHHIIPIKDDWNRRLYVSNVMSVSSASHSEIEQGYKADKTAMINKMSKMLKEYRANVRQGAV